MKIMIINESRYRLLLGIAFLLIGLSGCTSDDSSIGINPFAPIKTLNSSVVDEYSFNPKELGTEKDLKKMKENGQFVSREKTEYVNKENQREISITRDKVTPQVVDPTEVLNRADSYFASEKYYEAEKAYKQYFDLRKDSLSVEELAELNHQLGVVSHKRYIYNKAEEYYLQANSLVANQNPEYFFDYSKLMYDMKRYEEAEKCLVQLTETNSDNIEMQKYLGLSILKQHGRADCLEPLKKSVGELEAYHLLAEECYRAGDIERGETFETKMLNIAEAQQMSPPLIANKSKWEETGFAQSSNQNDLKDQMNANTIPAVGNQLDEQRETSLPVGFSSYRLPENSSDDESICEELGSLDHFFDPDANAFLLAETKKMEMTDNHLTSPQLLSQNDASMGTPILFVENLVQENNVFQNIVPNDNILASNNAAQNSNEEQKNNSLLIPSPNQPVNEVLQSEIQTNETNEISYNENSYVVSNDESKPTLSNLLIPALAETLDIEVDDQILKAHSEEKVMIETQIEEPYLTNDAENESNDSLIAQQEISLGNGPFSIVQPQPSEIQQNGIQMNELNHFAENEPTIENKELDSNVPSNSERKIQSASESFSKKADVSDQNLSELTNSVIHNNVSLEEETKNINISSQVNLPNPVQQLVPSSATDFSPTASTTTPFSDPMSEPITEPAAILMSKEKPELTESQNSTAHSCLVNKTENNIPLQNNSLFDNEEGFATSSSKKYVPVANYPNVNIEKVQYQPGNNKSSFPSYQSASAHLNNESSQNYMVQNSSNNNQHLTETKSSISRQDQDQIYSLLNSVEDYDENEDSQQQYEYEFAPAKTATIESWSENGVPSKNRKLVKSTNPGLQSAINLGAEVVELSPKEYKAALSKSATQAIERKKEYEKKYKDSNKKLTLQQQLDLLKNSSNNSFDDPSNVEFENLRNDHSAVQTPNEFNGNQIAEQSTPIKEEKSFLSKLNPFSK